MTGKVILDNAGGVTLQLPGYAHWYDDCKAAAVDLTAYMEGEDPATWDGNEPEAAELNPTDEQIKNGGYKIIYLDDLPLLSECEKDHRVKVYQSLLEGSADYTIKYGSTILYLAQDPYLDNDHYTALALDANDNRYDVTWQFADDFDPSRDDDEGDAFDPGNYNVMPI